MDKKTDLVKVDDKWLAENARLGTEDITAADLPIPRLKLIQKTSDATLTDGTAPKMGTFFYSAMQDAMAQVECTLLSVKKARKIVFNSKNKPTSQLTDEDYEDVFMFIGIRDLDEQPFLFDVRGSALSAAKNFLATVIASKKPLLHFKVKLESRYIESQKGNYYVVVFRNLGEQTDTAHDTAMMALTTKYSGVKAEEEEEITKIEDLTETQAPEKPQADDGDLPF